MNNRQKKVATMLDFVADQLLIAAEKLEEIDDQQCYQLADEAIAHAEDLRKLRVR